MKVIKQGENTYHIIDGAVYKSHRGHLKLVKNKRRIAQIIGEDTFWSKLKRFFNDHFKPAKIRTP